MKFVAKNLEETQKIASDFLLSLNSDSNAATVVGLYGDLGAGKTSFTQGVAKSLGIQENIVSPTFVIMKNYEIGAKENSFLHLIHIDAYRLDNEEELLQLGWEKLISDPKNLILIEWPEKVEKIMPNHISIKFSHIESDGREIEIL